MDLCPIATQAGGPEGPDGPDGPNGLSLPWALVSDAVMGGVSVGRMDRTVTNGRPALRLTGRVRLDNDGGFLQLATDLAPGRGVIDARGWTGLALDLCGNGEGYGVHLRTAGLDRPWQSFRADVTAGADWRRHLLPFAAFRPHRTAKGFDAGQLRRIGLIAIGRAFSADVSLGGIWLYRTA